MTGIMLLPSLLLLMAAPFILLNTYLLAWICGPAIRHMGKCFEQGRIRARADAEPRRVDAAYLPGAYVAAAVPRAVAAAPAIPKQTTPEIPTPDSGHRWLGSPTGVKR